MTDPRIDLRSEAALDTFIAGLDSPWHTPEGRREWCRLFLQDAAMGVLRLPAAVLNCPHVAPCDECALAFARAAILEDAATAIKEGHR